MVGLIIAISVIIVLSWWSVLWGSPIVDNPYSITIIDF
jgi:hypothetical protein